MPSSAASRGSTVEVSKLVFAVIKGVGDFQSYVMEVPILELRMDDSKKKKKESMQVCGHTTTLPKQCWVVK